jgi:hypothetical protein
LLEAYLARYEPDLTDAETLETVRRNLADIDRELERNRGAIAAPAAAPPTTTDKRRPADSKTLVVPAGPRPTLDGTILKDEWKQAIRRPFTNGGSVRFLLNDDRLYVGVRGKDAGWSHLVLQDGERVRVLHASNALGDVAYSKPKQGAWKLEGPFQWEPSGPLEQRELPRLLEKHLETHGWTATNNNAGRPTDIEFEIDLVAMNRPDRVRLVVVHSTDDVSVPLSVWPPKAKDDSINRELMNGSPPDEVRFNPKEWGVLKLSAGTHDLGTTSCPSGRRGQAP